MKNPAPLSHLLLKAVVCATDYFLGFVFKGEMRKSFRLLPTSRRGRPDSGDSIVCLVGLPRPPLKTLGNVLMLAVYWEDDPDVTESPFQPSKPEISAQ